MFSNFEVHAGQGTTTGVGVGGRAIPGRNGWCSLPSQYSTLISPSRQQPMIDQRHRASRMAGYVVISPAGPTVLCVGRFRPGTTGWDMKRMVVDPHHQRTVGCRCPQYNHYRAVVHGVGQRVYSGQRAENICAGAHQRPVCSQVYREVWECNRTGYRCRAAGSAISRAGATGVNE